MRDSGKTQVDAMIGEVLTTCEKLKWTIANGEKYLKDEPRDVGALMVMKKVLTKCTGRRTYVYTCAHIRYRSDVSVFSAEFWALALLQIFGCCFFSNH